MSLVEIQNLKSAHEDDRGSITDLLNATDPIHHLGLITFTKGAVRGNHYHKKSDQYDYVLEGEIEIAVRPADDSEAPIEKHVLRAGDFVHIPKHVIHAYRAVRPSIMIDITTVSREGSGYEDDTVRVEPIV